MNTNIKTTLILLLAMTLIPAVVWAGATITIVNLDGAGEGFNDPTPVAPVPGNPGVTVGEQRLIAFNHAADIWSCVLSSSMEIRIGASFDALFCDATSAVLGSAGPNFFWRDYAGAPLASTWFVDAEADAQAGFDLNPGQPDIFTSFNANIGTPGCLEAISWYYGLDNNPPPGTRDLLSTLLHEFAHGLGFLSAVNEMDGTPLLGFMDIYSRFLRDNTVGLNWDAMSDAQRVASAINDQNLVWSGTHANTQAAGYLCKETFLNIASPVIIAGNYTALLANFSDCGPNVSGPLELVNDGTGTTSDGCEAILGDLTGKIAVIDRGSCAFVTKVLGAQAAGAIGVIVVNNVATPPFGMSGDPAGINIPAVMVSQADGNAIKAELGGGVNGSISTSLTQLQGADSAGRVKMYAPNPLRLGSSVSHWDVSARPNLSMEPFATGDVGDNLDLSVPLFRDILWPLNTAPSAVCQNVLVLGDAACEASVTAAMVDNGSSDPEGDPLTLTLSPEGPYGAGPNQVLLIVDDGWLADTCQVTITVECPVPVKLAAFSVNRVGDTARLAWSVEDAVDHAGFHVYRQTGADRVRISDLIDGGPEYTFVDHLAPAVGADYWLAEVSRSGAVSWHGPVVLDPASVTPSVLSLGPAYPNPFAAATRLSYQLPEGRPVRISVYDTRGRLVRRLHDGLKEAGSHEVVWDGHGDDGSRSAVGFYILRLEAGADSRTQKIVLAR